ncbi:hypothetical protein ACH5RR_026591 [Cinchona calisaya]|uniref:Uncharacterized protein n=1 Tax=Cinchona calisaya TaxID=153742 RepID=A0ABD2Z452_9GENT
MATENRLDGLWLYRAAKSGGRRRINGWSSVVGGSAEEISRPKEESGNFALENRRLPPGRTGWPILGETLDYFSKLQQGVLEKFVTERRKRYDSDNIFRTSLIGQPMAILCNAEGSKFLFSNEKKLVQVWWPSSMDKMFPKSGNECSNEHSRRIRKVLHLILKADVLQEYVGIMDMVMKDQLRTDWNCKEVKVGDMAKKYISTEACNIFLGISDQGTIDELAKEMEDIATGLHSMPLNLPGTALNRTIKASEIMCKKVQLMVRQRKSEISADCSSSGKDLMSYLLVERDENGHFFFEEDIASHLVEQKEVADLKDPKNGLRWEDLRKMKYSWGAAWEVLRLMPPHLEDSERLSLISPMQTYNSKKLEGHDHARLAVLVFVHNVVTKLRREKLIPDENFLYAPVPRLSQGLPVRLHPHKP